MKISSLTYSLLLSLMVLLCACSRGQGDAVSPTSIAVRVTPLVSMTERDGSGFEPLPKRATAALSSELKSLLIFDVTGADEQTPAILLSQSTSDDANFLCPTMDLSAERHVLTFVATTTTDVTYDVQTGLLSLPNPPMAPNVRPMKVFAKTIVLDLTDGEDCEPKVVLSRITSTLRVTIKDVLAASVRYIRCGVYSRCQYLRPTASALTPEGRIDQQKSYYDVGTIVLNADKNKDPKVLDFDLLYPTPIASIWIVAKEENGAKYNDGQYWQRKLMNVTLNPGQVTIVDAFNLR